MKVLIIGDFHSEIHEKPLYDHFLNIQVEVYKFSWYDYFLTSKYFINLFNKVQNKYLFGPKLTQINADVIRLTKSIMPDLVFVYRGTHIYGKTLEVIKELGCILVGYNNDDPFSKKYKKYVWNNFFSGLKYYDHIFAYRKKNIEDYKGLGYINTSILLPFYIRSRNYPLEIIEKTKYECDVLFIGHYENDGRDNIFKRILELGIDLKIYGTEWENSKNYDYFKKKLGKIRPLREDYNICLNSAKIVLVLFSKLNNDTYTRRCFEIPAAGAFMLSYYTKEMDTLFKKGIEADYFNSEEELIHKICYYLNNDEERKIIAKMGNEAVVRGKHDAASRVEQIIRVYNDIKSLKENASEK